MCVSHDGDSGSATSADAFAISGGIEHIAVTAPRLTFNQDMLSNVDWGEVSRIAALTGVGGVYGGWGGVLGMSALGGLSALEAQPDVDLTQVLQTVYDLPIIPGYPAPYISMH
ncbi:MAG: hypothetical protein RIB46_20170 [Pseudomonadales bacterium]